MLYYNILSKLGEGGAGSVFLCRRKDNDEKYAIKRICTMNERHRDKIVNEIVLTKLSASPSIVSYYESYDFDGFL